MFIPVAEETGLIVPLGRWVLRTALAELAAWDRPHLTMSVNLSGRQLACSDLVDMVHEALWDTGVAASQLCLEITETALVKDMQRAATTLTDLKRLGVRLALDDFGQGQSSLGNLRRLPVDTLKIDKSFVAPLGTADQGSLVAAVVELAGALGLQTVAEGIETLEQMLLVRSLGCQLAQGYLFGPPAATPAIVESAHRTSLVSRL